jgi:hypothetical protein
VKGRPTKKLCVVHKILAGGLALIAGIVNPRDGESSAVG